MDDPDDMNTTDVLLLPFVHAAGEASEVYLSELLAGQTESTIKGIIRSQLRVSLSSTDGSHDNQEALDLLTQVQADLIAGLRALKSETPPRSIGNLHGYVAAIAFNACHQWLRRKYPRRLQLKNKLRYVLTHVPAFALWQTDERVWLCGFASGRATRPAPDPNPAGERGRGREALVELLTSIFHCLKKPAPLEDVVTLAADSLGIREDAAHSERGLAAEPRTGARAAAGILTELEQRAELRTLWSAIGQLPLRHRAALLLNLRDKRGADALELLPLIRIATIGEIAAVLSFRPEDFARIWNELPWDDLRIARHLGLSRQQVINLRQSARARLARQLRGAKG